MLFYENVFYFAFYQTALQSVYIVNKRPYNSISWKWCACRWNKYSLVLTQIDKFWEIADNYRPTTKYPIYP